MEVGVRWACEGVVKSVNGREGCKSSPDLRLSVWPSEMPDYCLGGALPSLTRTRSTMLLIVGIILFVLWLSGVTFFKVTKGVIHLLLLIAIIVIVVHFVGGV